MKYCPYCGEPLPKHDYKFCPECGERLNATLTGPGDEVLEPGAMARKEARFEVHIPEEELLSRPQYRIEVPLPGSPRNDEPEDACQKEEELGQTLDTWERKEADMPPSTKEVRQDAPEEDIFEPVDMEATCEPEACMGAILAAEPIDMPEEEPELWIRPDGWTPEDNTYHRGAPHRAHRAAHTAKGKNMVARVWPAFLVAVLLLGGAAGFITLKLQEKEAPSRAAERFAGSVYAGDVQTVLGQLETAGSGLSDAASVGALCSAIKQAATQQEFKAHLLSMGNPDAAGYQETLSAITFRQIKGDLFSQKFAVRVEPVPVLVKTGIMDTVLYVDDVRAEATVQENGFLLRVPPGRHSLRAVYEKYGTEYELGETQMQSLSSKTPSEVTLSQKTASVLIELSGVETDLVVTVDGEPLVPQPTGGWITLDPAFLGMDVTVECLEYAQSFEIAASGKQTLAVDYIGILEQKNPGGRNPAPELLSNRQLVDKLGKRFYTCYRSYLEASNQENEALIRDADEAYRASLLQNIKDYNSGYLFQYKSMQVDRRNISRMEKEGELFATIRVEVLYDYTKRAGSPQWMAGFNRQDVTLRYDKDARDWIVYGSKVNDALELTEDTFTIT